MEMTNVVEQWTSPVLLERLKDLGACSGSLAWLGDEDAAAGKGEEPGAPLSLSEAYEQLQRADWLLWLAGELVGDLRRVGRDEEAETLHRRLVLAACACARTALVYVPEGESRPQRAVELAEAWARGEQWVTREQVRAAAAAAYDPDTHAADAVGAAASSVDDADGAWGAAWSAAAAVPSTAPSTAWRSAHARALADMVSQVREHLPLDVLALALSQSRTTEEAAS